MFTRHRSKTLPSTSVFPRRIYTKTPSPELWPGQTAEKELGFGYDTIDQILWGLERWLSPKEIASDLSLPISMITRVRNRWLASEHKRRMPLTPKAWISDCRNGS